MFALVPVVLNLLLIYTGRVEAECGTEQCQSLLDPEKCIELQEIEDMDCVTYTCKMNSEVGHGVLVEDEIQEKRCRIHGHCYTAGDGPSVCTKCQKNDDGTVGVQAGCLTSKEECVPTDAFFQDGCDINICRVENNAVVTTLSSTTGCEYEGECYAVGKKTYGYTCNECTLNPETNCHTWDRECRDPRNNQCFEKGSVYDFFCRTFICDNRGGIGWHRHSGSHCEIAVENDCVAFNSTSMRNGYCYYCDETSGSQASVGCAACGECLRPGESIDCDGETHTCGNAPEPPEEEEIVCKFGSRYPEMKVGDIIDAKCNEHMCTPYGLKQLTQKCAYKTSCYDPGDMIYERFCIRCVSDGVTSGPERGCRFNGECYGLGETIRYYCRTKKCAMVNRYPRWVDTEYQQTPCHCNGQCYEVGPFDYGHDRLCAECLANGKIKYACRLHSGRCLEPGQQEEEPSLGCYRMQCTVNGNTYRIELVPGQSLQCKLPNGECIKENERRTIGKDLYVCRRGGVCHFKDNEIAVGQTVEAACHELTCEEKHHNGFKVYKMDVTKYGCKYGDTCKNLSAVYEEDCNEYKCNLEEGKMYAQPKLLKERCDGDGVCLEVGQFYWTPDCVRRDCKENSKLETTVVGCKASGSGTCVEPGQNLTVNGRTQVCPENNEENTDNNDGNEDTTVCSFANGITVPFGDSYNMSCSVYKCMQKGNIISLFIQGQPQCKLTYNGVPKCFPAGSSLYCVACNYDANNIRQPLSMEQMCRGDGGSCVPVGETVDYRCGKAVCNGITFRMDMMEEKPRCRFKTSCVAPGEYVQIVDKGIEKNCTCAAPNDDRFTCYY